MANRSRRTPAAPAPAASARARAARLALPSPGRVLVDREALQLALLRAYHGFIRHRGFDSAAALSFFATLVVFPAALSVVSLFALLDDKSRAAADVQRIVEQVAPPGAVAGLRAPIEQLLSIPDPAVALTVGVALTIWTLSGYVTAFGRSINTAYEVQEGRLWVVLRLKNFLVAAGLVVVGATIVVLIAGTPSIAQAAQRAEGLPGWSVIVWDIAKWPVLAALAILVVAVLYYYSPNVRHLRIRWVTLGALLAIVVWILATTGFAIYILNYSHYNRVYGWLGGAVILLLWLYLSNLVVVFGAEIDAEIVRVRQLIAGIDAQNAIQLPVRATRRIDTLERWLVEDEKRGHSLLVRARRERK